MIRRNGSTTLPPRALSALLVSLVAIPYTTVAFPFRSALYIQAVGLLAVLGAAGALGLLRGDHQRAVPSWTPSIRLGLALWSGATILGTVMGLVQGTPLRFLVGQALAMAFLPLGAWAGGLLSAARTPHVVSRALVTVGALAAAGHLGHWLLSLTRGQLIRRLFLDNSIALGSLSLLCLLLAVSLALAARSDTDARSRRRRRGVLSLCLLLGLYLVGTGIRGLWLLAPPSLIVLLLLWSRGRLSRPSGATLGCIAGGALAVLAVLGVHRSLATPRPNLVPVELASVKTVWSGSAPTRRVQEPFALPGRGSYRFSALVSGGEDGLGQVSVRWLDEWGERLGGISVWADVSPVPRWITIIDSAPEGTHMAEIVVLSRENARGTWTLEGLRLEALAPALPPLLVTQVAYFHQRLTAISNLLSPASAHSDNSFSIRWAENHALISRFAAAPLVSKLLGHGLGSTFGAGPGGAARLAEAANGEQNYIHNFYLFLLFKLGIAGTLAVLSALGIWIFTIGRTCWREEDCKQRAFLAASTSAWIAYSVLGLTSPELINFRFAPIFGVLLAASAWVPPPASRSPMTPP